jgi:hypothetical protein
MALRHRHAPCAPVLAQRDQETQGAQALAKLPSQQRDALLLLVWADLAGRTGLGFYMILDGHDKQEIVINPVTYAYMGGKSVAIKDYTVTGTDGTHYIRAGQVLGWDALLNPGDRRQARPASRLVPGIHGTAGHSADGPVTGPSGSSPGSAWVPGVRPGLR